jgi:hypothetical protein
MVLVFIRCEHSAVRDRMSGAKPWSVPASAEGFGEVSP